MRINNNIMAMNTHRQYTVNVASVAKSTEKLSSGYRVNRAGDDAAGLAISEKMRAQIRGLKMASKNSQDAISLVQTSEAALQETHNILQRMRELAVQSSSDTNETSIDRAALDAEFQQLINEVADTAKKTKFNDMGVIDGSYSGSFDDPAVAYDPAVTISAGFTPGTQLVQSGTYSISANVVSGTITFDMGYVSRDDGTLHTKIATLSLTDEQIMEMDWDGTPEKPIEVRLQLNDGTAFRFMTDAPIKTADDLLAAINAADPKMTEEFEWTGNPITIQTGANQGDEMTVNIAAMDADILGLNTLSIANAADARRAITRVNDAVNFVSSQRAVLGALQNRLNHKIQNLDTSAENLSAAESRIRDLDMAQEMTNYTRNNILVQASTSMLAQANATPQGVLSLLQ